MDDEVKELVNQLKGSLSENAYKISNTLGKIGSEEVVTEMIALLEDPNLESRIIAARTLSMIENNQIALGPIIEAVKNPENKAIAGDLLMYIEEFDVSDMYVELFRLYLFGSFKVSLIARDLLDHAEFNITPRVLKKAKKHWDHFLHNTRKDENFEIKKTEVEAMLADLQSFLDENG